MIAGEVADFVKPRDEFRPGFANGQPQAYRLGDKHQMV